jgi:phage protein D
MAVSFQLNVSGMPAPAALQAALQSVEVEENADTPDAMTITLPVTRTASGDLTYVDDGTFEPYTPVSVVLTAGTSRQCVFDGYALSWGLHLDRASTDSMVRVWAQDASWLMNINDVVREWAGVTDGQVANSIFSSYGFSPADGNTDDDSPTHDPDEHTLFQRATDLQFLHGLARRNGKICRVACADKPGDRTGYFIRPALDGTAAVTISLVNPVSWNVDTLDVDWDVMRPTEVDASQASLTDAGSSVSGDATSSGLAAMAARDLPAYSAKSSTMRLTATADAPELTQRTAAVLTESGWFARCEGEADLDRLGAVLRPGMLVAVDGGGKAHSGNWFVWRVNHHITSDSCRSRFTLVRNAIGPLSTAPGAGQ